MSEELRKKIHRETMTEIVRESYRQMAFPYLEFIGFHYRQKLKESPHRAIALNPEREGLVYLLRLNFEDEMEVEIGRQDEQRGIWVLGKGHISSKIVRFSCKTPMSVKAKNKVGVSYYFSRLIEVYAQIVSLYGQPGINGSAPHEKTAMMPHCMFTYPSLVINSRGFEVFKPLDKRLEEQLAEE